MALLERFLDPVASAHGTSAERIGFCHTIQSHSVIEVKRDAVRRPEPHASMCVTKPMNRFAQETILEILREVELGTPLRELRRKHGFSEASYYYWRAKYGRGAQVEFPGFCGHPNLYSCVAASNCSGLTPARC